MSRYFRLVRRAVLCVLVAAASPAALEAQDVTTRVFQIEHVLPSSLRETLVLFDVPLYGNNDLKTLTVSAPPATMTAIADVIARLDVPAPVERERAVELTMRIMSASDQGAATSVPAVLDPVVTELRNVFSYRNFQVLDTVLLRVQDGREANTSGTITTPPFGSLPEDLPTFFNFHGQFSILTPDSGAPLLRITEMRTSFRVPVPASRGDAPVAQFQYIDVSINTDVDIATGQQVVVGKATVGPSALILVMSANFLD